MTDRVIPRPEAVAAAAWWASRLGRASQDTGDRESSAFATIAAGLAGRSFTDEQVAAFRRELAVTIEEHLRRWDDTWKTDQPQWGAALRSFGCDYHPEHVLASAAERAGFKVNSLDLPMKTTMWVNPGVVRVGEGYRADVVTVWEAHQ